KGIINKKKKSILSESLKVINLAEQVFGTNHAGSRLANEINEWYSISGKVNENIRQACVEHGHVDTGMHPIIMLMMSELPEDDITGFAQRFLSGTENILHIEVKKDIGKKKDGHLLYFYDNFL
ncbi:13618_t:CDS:2, partial [Racocetra persica]